MAKIKLVKNDDPLRRSRELKKLHRLRRWSFRLIFFLILPIIVLALVANWDRLLIETVKVEGNTVVDTEEIKEVVEKVLDQSYLFIFPRRNTLLYPKRELVSTLANHFPYLNEIVATTNDWTNLTIKVTERRATFLWCPISDSSDGSCYFMDHTGLIFSPAPLFSSQLFFEFRGLVASDPLGTRPWPSYQVAKLNALRQSIDDIFSDSLFSDYQVMQASQTPDGDFEFIAVSGEQQFKLIISLAQEIEVILTNLRAMLTSPDLIEEANMTQLSADQHYIDLRFSPKVFYKLH